MVTVAAVSVLVVMVMIMAMMLMCHRFQILGYGILALHSFQKLSAGQLLPGSCDQGSSLIVLAEKLHSLVQLCLRNAGGTGKNNGRSSFHLIVIELAEVLHIHLDLARIYHSDGIAKLHILAGDLFHCGNDIGELAHTGRLNNHTVGVELLNHLFQRLSEVAHQTAADAAGVHLRNVNAGILQKTAVNANLTKLIFNEDNLLTAVGFLNHLFNQGRFTGAKKTGININFSHSCDTFLF